MSELAIQNREQEQEVMPSFDFLLERESERNTLLAEHRAWLKEIKRERPLPKTHHRVAVYIRYFMRILLCIIPTGHWSRSMQMRESAGLLWLIGTSSTA